MKKQASRVKDWRERQKAEGKTSITVLLSQEVRSFLMDEKERTGDSYSVIIERALQTAKKQGYRRPVLKYFPNREDSSAKITVANHQLPEISRPHSESAGQPKILIDDFVNYPSIRDLEHEEAEKKNNGLSASKSKKGLINRLLSSSAGLIGMASSQKKIK